MAAEQRRRLVIEFELPTFYADDVLEALEFIPEEFRENDSAEILEAIGGIRCGALTIEVAGEKDSDIVTVPVLARAARIEKRAPSRAEWLDAAVERLIEQAPGYAARLSSIEQEVG